MSGTKLILQKHYTIARKDLRIDEVVVKCPLGDHHFVLTEFEVNREGYVSPDVECPSRGCGFAERIQLDEWPFEEKGAKNAVAS